jgi:glucan phosphoethanolaminetransferase (alkaline phosphatase superfamily)
MKKEMKLRLFYLIALPSIWAVAAITSYFHPGDEYGLLLVSSIAGAWVCFGMENVGHVRDVLWIIVLTGVAVLAALGFVMDRLRISKRIWGTLFGLCFVIVLVLSILQYPSLDRAIRKNGSITAYIAASCNVGLYLSIVLASIGKGVVVAARRIISRRNVEPSNAV